MKRIITFAAVALSAAFAFAGYEDWYTPAQDFKTQKTDLTFWVGNKKVPMIQLPLEAKLPLVEEAVEQAVEAAELSENAKNAFALGKRALSEAMFAQLQSEMNRQKIDSLGASVETIFQLTNADKVDSSGAVISSGKLADGVRDKMLAKKNALIGKGGTGGAGGEGGEAKPLQIQVTDFHYDTREFEQIQMNGNKSKMGLKGFKDLRPNTGDGNLDGADGFALEMKGYHIPMTTGGNGEEATLQWAKWNGWDEDCFSAGDDGGTGSQNSKPLHLRYWNGGDGGCSENLQNLLTNKNESIAADRRNHYFLTRYGDNNAQTHDLHWLSMAEAAMEVGGGEPNVDDHSIALAQDEDASPDDPKKLRLKGFDAAKTARTEDGKVPIVPNIQPTGDDLHWDKFSDFFADSVFKTSDTTGRVMLNGTTESGKMTVLAISEDPSSPEGQKLESMHGDGKSVDLGYTPSGQPIPVVQIHDWNTPDFWIETEDTSDILTNPTVNVTGWSMLFRDANGDIRYAPVDKLVSISVGKVDAVATDDASITTNSSLGAVMDNIASLYGWKYAVQKASGETSIVFPYVNGNVLGYSALADNFSAAFRDDGAGTIELNVPNTGKPELYTVISPEGQQEIAVVEMNEDCIELIDDLGLKLQLLSWDAPADSGAGTTFANLLTNNAYSTAGWFVPLRNSGGKLVYSSLDKIVTGGNPPIDEKSLNTFQEGGKDKMQVYGFKDAEAGSVPYVGSAHLNWSGAATEDALLNGNGTSVSWLKFGKGLYKNSGKLEVKYDYTKGLTCTDAYGLQVRTDGKTTDINAGGQVEVIYDTDTLKATQGVGLEVKKKALGGISSDANGLYLDNPQNDHTYGRKQNGWVKVGDYDINGTDGSASAEDMEDLNIISADDSNVKTTVTKAGNAVTIKIGVYYK